MRRGRSFHVVARHHLSSISLPQSPALPKACWCLVIDHDVDWIDNIGWEGWERGHCLVCAVHPDPTFLHDDYLHTLYELSPLWIEWHLKYGVIRDPEDYARVIAGWAMARQKWHPTVGWLSQVSKKLDVSRQTMTRLFLEAAGKPT